jgi:hypothetical protein
MMHERIRKHPGYAHLTVCERWSGTNGFANFLADMGERPDRFHTIDRMDNDYGYQPDNCIWATKLEQTRNRKCVINLTIDGVTRNIQDWCEYMGLHRSTYQSRRRRGMSMEDAILTPPKKHL